MESKLLEGIKVVELASVLAGPAVGMFFAELGAEVIKIENKRTNGDVTRTWRLPTEPKDTEVSAYYAAVNWGKEVLMLNLKADEDRQRVRELIKEADIVIANYKVGSAEKLGMDAKTLTALNPKLIYANLTGFPNGSTRPAFDVVLQAETGFMYMNGQPESPPTKMPVALIDILAAHQLKEGILLALWKRERTGKGSVVDASLFGSSVAALANQATNWLMGNHIPQRMGSLHPNIAPYGEQFITADDKILVLAIGNDKQYQGLCRLLDMEDLTTDQRFVNNGQRVKNRTALSELLKIAFAKVNAASFLEQCHQQNIPIGQVRNMQQVFEQKDAQALILEENTVDHQMTKRVKTVAFDITDS